MSPSTPTHDIVKFVTCTEFSPAMYTILKIYEWGGNSTLFKALIDWIEKQHLTEAGQFSSSSTQLLYTRGSLYLIEAMAGVDWPNEIDHIGHCGGPPCLILFVQIKVLCNFIQNPYSNLIAIETTQLITMTKTTRKHMPWGNYILDTKSPE